MSAAEPIKVCRVNDDGSYFPDTVVPIYRRGVWAVTEFAADRPPGTPKPYCVTHVPSGMGVWLGDDCDSGRAIDFCRALDEKFPDHAADAAFGQLGGVATRELTDFIPMVRL